MLQTFAQEKTRIRLISADELIGDKSLGDDVNIFTGNVIFEHDSAFLYCDSAVLFGNRNTLDAYFNVHIEMSDTLNLYGDILNYDGNTRIATITGNVILKDNEATLKTDRMIYERNTRIAFYKTGGTILSDENTLKSLLGYYYTDDKLLHFKKNVELINEDFLLQSDTLIYHTVSKIAYIHGPTTIEGEDEFLYTEDGWYDTQQDFTWLKLNSYMIYKEQFLSGDQIHYQKEPGIGQVFGNVFIEDTIQDIIITGDYADYRRKDGYAFATDSAEVIMIDARDSLYLHADTILITFDSADSPQWLHAYYKSRFYKTDLQGMSDSLVYSFSDSTINMFFNPVIWTQNNQITAKEIKIFTSNQRADSMYMTSASFIVAQDEFDESKFNQIKGKDMVAYFSDNELYLINVDGNSETIYFAREETGALIGVNNAVSSRMKILIENRQVTDIFYLSKPEGNTTPLEQTTPEQLFLRDFNWRKNDRPLHRYDIFRWPDSAPALR
jgi:lipopolysaccharide export system protein LptA